jgi:serine/threonine protein kinase
MLSLEGKQLGNYDVIRRIRAGGMGTVYEGRQHTAFGRRVAIKVILGDYATDKDMRRRFAREARTVARLHHPHILPLIEFGDSHGILYLVMPFIEGGTLTSYLRHSLPNLAEVTAIYEQLLDAVEYAHDEGLIHRDIKSSNVLLEMRRSGPPHVYLADFGLVRTLKSVDMDDTGKMGKPIPLDQVPGTPHYMAPEQTRGIVTPLTDIYALGVMLYQLLTGDLPYNDPDDVRVIQMHMHAPIPSPSDHDASIPRELDAVVQTAMAKRSDARYRSISELRTAFLSALKGSSSAIHEEETVPEAHNSAIPVSPLSPTETPQQRPATATAPSTDSPPQPAPILMQRRIRADGGPPLVIREGRVKARTTDTARHKLRITEEPTSLRKRPVSIEGSAMGRRPLRIPLLGAILVPVLLLALLLAPRILNLNLFPPGFPLLGSEPVATIYVTAQSRIQQDSYVLTASPKVKEANTAAHIIPARIISSAASASKTVETRGIRTIPGTAARGIIEFLNTTSKTITVPAGQVLVSNTGVRILLTQDAHVPPRDNGRSGRIQVSAVAAEEGIKGNIPAHSLDGSCCNNGVTSRNFQAFTGGTDGQIQRIVTQDDLDGVQQALRPQLEKQVLQQLQRMPGNGEALAGKPIYKVSMQANAPVGTQADRVQVTIKVTGNATLYQPATATDVASALLKQDALQRLGAAYQLRGTTALVGQPVVSQGKDGIVFLNVTVRGLWVYKITQEEMKAWPGSIKGSPTAAALAFLNARPGIKSVQIQLPFGADHLPASVNEIKIVLVDDTTHA